MISSSASEQDTGHKLARRVLRLQVFLKVCVESFTEYWEKILQVCCDTIVTLQESLSRS